jgi:two-component system nitrate/nitrite response regulator NarL
MDLVMGVRQGKINADGATIWVVDDEDLICRSVARGLRLRGFTDIHTITKAEDVLRHIVVGKPDLIIQDVNLDDDVDGIDVTRIIRNRGYRGKVLMYTGDTTHETLFRAALAGANDYVVKPESSEFICDEVQRVLDGRRREGPQPDHHEAFKEGAYVRSRNGSELEIDLLSEICRDYPSQEELATRLGKTPSTIRKETSKIRKKLECDNFHQLAHVMTVLEIFARRSLEDWEHTDT